MGRVFLIAYQASLRVTLCRTIQDQAQGALTVVGATAWHAATLAAVAAAQPDVVVLTMGFEIADQVRIVALLRDTVPHCKVLMVDTSDAAGAGQASEWGAPDAILLARDLATEFVPTLLRLTTAPDPPSSRHGAVAVAHASPRGSSMKSPSQPAEPTDPAPPTSIASDHQRSDAVAALALHFAESLDLPVVLNQVAQQTSTFFNGVCRVRFAPHHRPADRRRVVAGPGDAAQAPEWAGVDATYAALLARLSDQDACNTGASWEAHQPPSCSAALLFAPLIARDVRIGTIDVVIPAAECCDIVAHQRTLRTIAAHAALAIDTADRFARPDRSTAGNVQQPAQADASALLTLIAHDLRGPLTALSSSIQMLVRAAKQPANAANQQITRLTELAEVAVTQLETQISALTPRAGAQRQSGGSAGEPVDLVQLAHLMANFYQQTTARQRFIVVADVVELYCRCPRSHAERVLGNLLVNAIKYSSAGSDIRIIVNREEDLIGDWAALSVQNDGIGIPAQDLTHLTNPGFRATNVGPIPGTGFGLASVREVVEQYGGTFAVQSAVGAATTVQIRLPLSGQPHQQPVHAAYAHA